MIEKFKKMLKWIGHDGLLHILVSALIMVALGWVRPIWIALLLVVLVGLSKELYDATGKGTASWHDIICDVVGIVIGMLIVAMLRFLMA